MCPKILSSKASSILFIVRSFHVKTMARQSTIVIQALRWANKIDRFRNFPQLPEIALLKQGSSTKFK